MIRQFVWNIFLVLAGLLLFAPVVIFGLYGFSTRYFYPQLIPSYWSATTFLRQLTDARTRQALILSLEIGTVVSCLSLLVGYPAARTLGMRPFRGKSVVYMLLFVPTVVPPVATGIGLNILFLRTGLAGTVLGVALVHLVPVLPYVVFTLSSVFARYDPHYEYQALVLGASRVQVFWTVTLPLIFPGIVVATLFAFLISWSQYLLTFLIGGGQVITLPILLFSTVSGGNPQATAVLSLIFVAPVVVILIATSRYLATDRVHGQSGITL